MRKRLRTLARIGVVLLVGAAILVRFGNDLARLVENDRPSVAHEGWLENGKRLPTSGPNFVAYSHPDVLFVYGETGWPSGGR